MQMCVLKQKAYIYRAGAEKINAPDLAERQLVWLQLREKRAPLSDPQNAIVHFVRRAVLAD